MSALTRAGTGLLAVALLAAGCGGGEDAPVAKAPPAQVFPGLCPVEPNPAVQIGCGTVAVPRNHDDPGKGFLNLEVMKVASRSATKGTPVIVLSGGPGEALVSPSLGLLVPGSPLLALAQDRDVVFFDQRGTGSSAPAMGCPEIPAALAAANGPDDVARLGAEAAATCRARLKTDPSFEVGDFDTGQNVRDIDVVRRAFGFDRVALLGTSYGARLGLQAVRDSPSWVESVALSSPIPAEKNFITDAADSFDRSLQAIGDACDAQPSCAAAYPDTVGVLQRLVRDLDAKPITLTARNPLSGRTVPTRVDGAVLASAVFSTLFLTQGPMVLPALVHRIASGDASLVAALLGQGAGTQVAQGQQLSFLCAEEAKVAGPEDVSQGSLGIGERFTDLSPVVGPRLWDLCKAWDVPPTGGDLFDPIRTTVPLLVVSGEFDQITPPSYGDEVAGEARTAYDVVVPGGGHGPLLAAGACGVAVASAFFADPSREPDTTCLRTPVTFPTTPAALAAMPGLGAFFTAG